MRAHLKSRLRRLERAEAEAASRLSFKVRCGNLKRLPREYTGERRVEIVKWLAAQFSGQELVEFEERPGPAPEQPSEPSTERIINVCYPGAENDR